MFEFFDTLRRPFRQSFDSPIIEILHEPNHLMPGRRALRKKSVAYALHVAANEKSSRNPVAHCLCRRTSILAPGHQLNNRETTGGDIHHNRVVQSVLFRNL